MALVTKEMFESYNSTMNAQDSRSCRKSDAQKAARGGSGGGLRFKKGDTIWFLPLKNGEMDIRETHVNGGERAYFTCTVLKNDSQLIGLWESSLEREVKEHTLSPTGLPIPTKRPPVKSTDPLGSKATNMYDFWTDHKYCKYELQEEPTEVATKDFEGTSLTTRFVYQWTNLGKVLPDETTIDAEDVEEVSADVNTEVTE